MDAYSLGQSLAEARQAKEIEIADAVARLRIHQTILESFEAGEFEIEGLPEIQVRGMLRIYARLLDMDEEHTLLLFDQMRSAQTKGRSRRRRRVKEPAPTRETGPAPLQEIDLADRRSAGCRGCLRLLLLLIFSAIALAIIAFVTLELINSDSGENGQSGESGESAPPPSATFPPTLAIEISLPTSTVAVDAAAPPSNRAVYTGSGVSVSLLLKQRSWLSLQVDGREVYASIAPPGTLLEETAENEITVIAANALALDIIWNGQQQGEIGARGQRVDIRFTVDDLSVILGPVATATLEAASIVEAPASPTVAPATEPAPIVEAPASPTATPSTAPTATATASPAPSATPLPSATPTPTNPPLPSATPTSAATAKPTAVLPPRVTQVGLPPTKPSA